MTYKRCRSAAVAILTLAACATAAAQSIEFMSLNRKQGFPAILEHRMQLSDKISATLTRPPGVSGDVPAMVIMHSSGGINSTTWEWSKFFLNMGVATLVVDSFTPRGIQTSTADQAQLNYAASTADALMALKTLAAQPGIDATRIGVIGFSRGALAAATASFENIRAGVLGDSPLKFALHIPFYGGCTLLGTTTGAPWLLFAAKDDDFVSAKSCTFTVDKMKERGAHIDYVLYPNAFHAFDVERDKTQYVSAAQSWKNCVIGQDLDDMRYYADSRPVSFKEYSDYLGQCMSKGATVALNFPAKSDSRSRTAFFVKKVFGL